MLYTRECDYAIRILRALSSNETLSVHEICERENITVSIAYKITRKLEKAEILQSFRGASGGYALKKSLKDLTLYDVSEVMDKSICITECMGKDYQCTQNTASVPCLVHKEFLRIQKIVNEELKKKTIDMILNQKQI